MSSTRVFEQLINHLEMYKTLQFHNDSIVNLARVLNIRLSNEIEEHSQLTEFEETKVVGENAMQILHNQIYARLSK